MSQGALRRLCQVIHCCRSGFAVAPISADRGERAARVKAAQAPKGSLDARRRSRKISRERRPRPATAAAAVAMWARSPRFPITDVYQEQSLVTFILHAIVSTL